MDRSASKKLRAFLLLSLCALLAVLGSAPGQVRASAGHLQATPAPQPALPAGPDLSGATLRLEDFPTGVEAVPEDQVDSISSTAERLMRGVSRVSQATLQNLAGYRSADLQNPQFAISYLLAPLSRADQTGFDQGVANPEPVLNALAQALTSSGAPSSPPRLLDGTRGIGNTSIGFSLAMRSLGRSFRIDMVIARRAEVAEAVMVMYLDGQPPQVSAVDLARLLDGRVMAIVGSGTGGGFRPAGPLVPELTTYIPTPLDISTDPAVIGANLLFAALATILFTIASEILNRTLAEHDRDLQRVLKPARGVGRVQQRIEAALRTRLGKASRVDATKLIGIMLFYGLIFSCLDRSWNPVSLTGVWLLVTMAIAFGVVGIADDIAQWRAAKRWGLSADLTLRPSNLLLAVASTGFSRVFAVVPGIMFGTPEAFHVDKAALGEQGEARLMKISARTLLLIGAGAWLITILTALVRQSTPTDSLGVLAGGVESLLLLVFAVAAQNIFIQMLALPDTFGRALLRFNRWLWFGGLLAITFVFYHTLINPRGDLVGALSSTNVIAFLATVGAFLVFSLVIWVYFKWQVRRAKRPTPEALARSETPVAPVPVAPPRVEEAPAQPQVEAPIAETRRDAPPIAPSLQPAVQPVPRPSLVMPPPDQRTVKITGATKPCPMCCGEIKAEARVCRHCKARFDIAVKGYCLNCHTVVDVSEENRCARCGGDVVDRHIVSTLIALPPVPATQAAVASEAHAAPAVQPTVAALDHVEAARALSAPRSGFP
ncbi:MAG TPA: hypothetical protein VJ754_08765, partial [Anaerolineae bacterium]|nr:hypothetical protein [Anaerolineae bacterium]